ncbi:hypothetical protein L1049_019033 [Liquidambar formosana]|uniref:Rad7 n=1 Tax=Liquidambar formosana TaxID=63359 RepID=A0AAP0RAY8_LIQFO
MEIDPFVEGSNSMSGRRRYTKEEKGKGKIVDNWLSISNGESEGGLDLDFRKIGIGLSADGSDFMNEMRRYSEEEKGKGKEVNNWLSISTEPVVFDLETEEAAASLINLSELPELEETTQQNKIDELEYRRKQALNSARDKASNRRENARRNHEIASERASELARLNPNQLVYLIESSKGKGEMLSVEADKELEDLDGPFSTALKIIKERNSKLNAKHKTLQIEWTPSRNPDRSILVSRIPSLVDLSIDVLAKNAEAIVSLEPAPDALKHKLSHAVCDYRKMNCQFVELLVRGSPTEVRVKDCSWMTEDQFTNIFRSWDITNLRVLQLDLCGRCMDDYTLNNTLAHSSNSFLALVSISLRGACRLSDKGLNELTLSAPSLQSVNLGQCSLLTSAGIDTLANCLGPTLRELYIDECQNIDAFLILPALKKFEHLEVLSVAGIQTVCDEFVFEIITAYGPNMKELVLADCVKLTDISLKVIGSTCCRLCSLDLFNLDKLTDAALLYLANGCQSIQTLKFCRNDFSDEAIAAFLEVSGKSLKELSLNNISKVGPNTALSLSKYSRNLLSLDLSWCRKLMDEDLGLIVDSCLSMRLLKLFGCTQITDVFLNGHSNSSVQIIGLKNTAVLKHLNVLETQEAPLRYSPLTFSINS